MYSFVVSGWMKQSRSTFFPFSSVVKTPTYPLDTICFEICRFRESFSSSDSSLGLKWKQTREEAQDTEAAAFFRDRRTVLTR